MEKLLYDDLIASKVCDARKNAKAEIKRGRK